MSLSSFEHPMKLAQKLWRIPRSITGAGVRQTLSILNEIVPLAIKEFPSGQKVLDWTIPQEWKVNKAYVKRLNGETVVDFDDHNLHLLGYSTPFAGIVSKNELASHIYTLPNQPNAIPYHTSYYTPRWGFCMEHERFLSMNDDKYEVCIDTELFDGFLTLADGFIQGESDDEVLFSTYVCHPMMANNELSGPIVQTMLYKWLANQAKPKYSYRFIYIPETIGSIVYLHHYGKELKEKTKAGFVITCVGDNGDFTYKKTRLGNRATDKVAQFALENTSHKVLNWFPTGSDERQYCSPAFDLPIGSITRSMYGMYPEYHTSLDNLDFISEEGLVGSFEIYKKIVNILENNHKYQNMCVGGEPQLGSRGLYHTLSGAVGVEESVQANLWVLAYADAEHDLIDISRLSGIDFEILNMAAKRLVEAGLIKIS